MASRVTTAKNIYYSFLEKHPKPIVYYIYFAKRKTRQSIHLAVIIYADLVR